MSYQYLDSPLGQLRLVSDGSSITHIEFEGRHAEVGDHEHKSDRVLEACSKQLSEYFRGKRKKFQLPLAPGGTPFQNQVWNALRQIPYGQVCSYGDIAKVIKRPRAVRAVGAANGRNPIPIVVPCHRVIGGDGSLTGFAGGLRAKKLLLELEGWQEPD